MPNLSPWGSHPLVEPSFTTQLCRVHYDELMFSRLDKVRLLLDWPAALAGMRVCNETRAYSAERLNCGVCEKCMRTRLALLALGALDRATAFAPQPITRTAGHT